MANVRDRQAALSQQAGWRVPRSWVVTLKAGAEEGVRDPGWEGNPAGRSLAVVFERGAGAR